MYTYSNCNAITYLCTIIYMCRLYSQREILTLWVCNLDAAYVSVFKPGAHGLWPRIPGLLKLLWFTRQYAYVCLSVCSLPRALITSGMI